MNIRLRLAGDRRRSSRTALLACAVAVLFCAVSSPAAAATQATKAQQQEDVRKAAQETLARLYKLQPQARSAVERSAGYAVFSNFGMKILVAGGGKGSGVTVNNRTKAETFMKMVEIQAGLGFGVKKFRLIWVLETQKAFDKFVNAGWELGGQTTAEAQMSGKGAGAAGAMSVSPGVWLYQITDDGLALELTAKGTKYYRDDELN